MPMGMDREESKKMLMEKASELKDMAKEYDIPLDEILGGDMKYSEGADSIEGVDDEMSEGGEDVEKAIKMVKAMRA